MPPGPHLDLTVFVDLRLCAMPLKRLAERDVDEPPRRTISVLFAESREHRAVALCPQDTLKDHVKAVAKCEPAGQINKTDISCSDGVVFAQDNPPQVILTDDRQSASVLLTYQGGNRRLSASRVAPDDDESGRPRVGGPAFSAHPKNCSGTTSMQEALPCLMSWPSRPPLSPR
jgi:hypothetical protein